MYSQAAVVGGGVPSEDEQAVEPESIRQISDALAKMNKLQKVQPVPTTFWPDKLTNFAGRENEIQKVIDHLQTKTTDVLSLVGNHGFGKTAIAIQVSHKLSEDHNIPVIFSQLTPATNENEMIRQICLDVCGFIYDDDPKSSLILWLKNIKKKIIWVIDDIDNLVKDSKSFFLFAHQLLKQHCQIVTTSTIPYTPSHNRIDINKMDKEESMELLKKQCRKEYDCDFLSELARRCDYVPLAMCIAGSLVDEYENSDELLRHLKVKQPTSDQYVNQAINLSYEKCSDEEKETFVRLSVFEGSFSKAEAEFVIEKDTGIILQKLVSRSLIEQPTEHRYSIHSLIKHFLNDKQKSGDKKAEEALAAARRIIILIKKAEMVDGPHAST